MTATPGNFYEAVYSLVRKIPRGRVMTYGQVAAILGTPRAARAVGYAMLMCGDKKVPWQRVINRHGGISLGGDPDRPAIQRALLRKEGIRFNKDGLCNLKKYQWEPKDPDAFLYVPPRDFPF